MRIVIINSDANHPINPFLDILIDDLRIEHDVQLVRSQLEISEGNVLFLVSCVEKISPDILQIFDNTFVLHASDLPMGRGWSPHIWQILEGKEEITISMLEASEEIDAGAIWEKRKIHIPKDALWDEINQLLFFAEIDLIRYAIDNFKFLKVTKNNAHIEPTYYRKRTPVDSEIDITRPLNEQFDLLRVCDPNRYPPYFKIHGMKYKVIVEKIKDD